MDRPEEQQTRPAKPPFYQRKEFPPLAVFGGFVLILLLSTAFSGRPPGIDNVTQEDNLASEIVTITGSNFGAPGTGGEVRIGDLALIPSNYLRWSDNKIIVTVPREVSSGIIYVVTKTGSCRGDIYMNPDEIPRLTSYRGPLIESLSSQNLAPGRVLVIKGERFGAERLESRVSFSQLVPTGQRQEERTQAGQLVSASDADGDYLVWSDHEIRVRVPEGAKTGPVMVTTDKGQSNNKYVTVISPVGRREYRDRVSYRLRAGALVTANAAVPPNTLDLYPPAPVACSEQRSLRSSLLATSGPDAAAAALSPRFAFTDLVTGQVERLSIEYNLDRYAVTTEIDPALLTDAPDPASSFFKTFTGDDDYVKPSHPALAAFLRAAAGTEKNPYLAARKIYDAVIEQLAPGAGVGAAANPDWYAILAAKTGDSFVYAALFSAAARKAGIPARLAAGYFVDDSRTAHPHYWSEFYIEDFGWVPVDPFLADRASDGPEPGVSDPANFYFGSLDNRHIAFSKGIRSIAKTDPQARTIVKAGAVGLQTFHEQVTGDIRAYATAWEALSVLENK